MSVIIPTLNAEAHLEQLIQALRAQDQPIYEILVIDSGSQDQTVNVAKKLPVKLLNIKPDTFDHGATRNRAAAESDADILIFMTQDVFPFNNQTIGNLIKPLQDQDTVVSYARQLPSNAASPSEKYLRLANYPPSSLIKTKNSISTMGIRAFQNSNVCSAYRHKEFNELGGFPQPAVCNEDMIFAAKAIFAGYRVSYTAEAKVWHTHKLSSLALFKRYFDLAASLDHEPRIRKMGRAESSGIQFFKNQILFLRKEKQLKTLPRVIVETGAKYLGYKCGSNHNLIPAGWKQYFGSNKKYWTNNTAC